MNPIKISLKSDKTLKPSEAVQYKTQLIDAFANLDICALEELISEEDCFEDRDKWTFLSHYRDKFQKYKNLDIGKLVVYKSRCYGCNIGKEVTSFGNSNGDIYFGILFKETNGLVTDVFECNAFEDYFKSIP